MPCDPGSCTLIGGPENMKLLFDMAAQSLPLVQQMVADNQADARAWRALNLRREANGQAFDHLVNMTAAASGQIGTTEGQASVTPIRTAAADTEVQQPAGAVYPPIRNVDQGAATANTGIQAAMQAIADAMANLNAAITTVLTTAAGGASTPSQTKVAG